MTTPSPEGIRDLEKWAGLARQLYDDADFFSPKKEWEALSPAQRFNWSITAKRNAERALPELSALPPSITDDREKMREEIEDLIREHWTCMLSNSTSPECPANSPCPACETRVKALGVLRPLALPSPPTRSQEP